MPVRATTYFKLDKKTFLRTGAFNPWLDVDSPLFVDPTLLEGCPIPEFRGSRELVLKHYELIFRLLVKAKPGDALWDAAVKRVAFHEMPGIALGYASKSTQGGGIGLELAASIVQTAKEIIEAGIDDPIIFEIVGLFEKGIGSDRISDMACRILGMQVYAFTERVFEQFKHVQKVSFQFGGRAFQVPCNPYRNQPVLLVPMGLLDELPTALDRDDVDLVCAHNEALRERFNALLGEDWARNAKKYGKVALKKFLLEHPDLLKELISGYRKFKKKPYDFRTDVLGEFMLDTVREQFETNKEDFKPLLALGVTPTSSPFDVVMAVCETVKRLVEEKAMWKLLYCDSEYQKPKHEEVAQILFAGIAEGICAQCNIDATREPETGRGPVDFKFSRGSQGKVLVEAKLSTNPYLVHAYDTQVQIYQEAERAEQSIIVVFIVSENMKQVDKLMAHAATNHVSGKTPKVLLIDARPKRSASKA